MKIAFSSKEKSWDAPMDARFGRSAFFTIYNDVDDALTYYDNSSVINEAHGAGPKAAQTLFELGVKVLITGNGPGGNAAAVIDKAGIEVFVGAGEMTVKEALEAYSAGKLNKA